MLYYGVDYSRDKPTPAELKAANISFACRYLAYLPNSKVIDAGELSALHKAGIGVVFNWEQAAGDMGAGATKGREHATEAAKQLSALKVPHTFPVYFSCDFDVTSTSQMNAVAAYLDAAGTVLGSTRVGVYGQYSVIEKMVGHHCKYGWQTYAWSGGKISAKAHLYQYHNNAHVGGNAVDLDKNLKDDFGCYFPEKKGQTMVSLSGYTLPELLSGDNDDNIPGYRHVVRAQKMLNYLGASIHENGLYDTATVKAVKDILGGDGKKITVSGWATLYGLSKAAAS